MDIKTKDYTRRAVFTSHDLDQATSYCGTVKRTKGGPLWALRVKFVPNDMAVCFNHADSFGLDHFDQRFLAESE